MATHVSIERGGQCGSWLMSTVSFVYLCVWCLYCHKFSSWIMWNTKPSDFESHSICPTTCSYYRFPWSQSFRLSPFRTLISCAKPFPTGHTFLPLKQITVSTTQILAQWEDFLVSLSFRATLEWGYISGTVYFGLYPHTEPTQPWTKLGLFPLHKYINQCSLEKQDQ